MFPNSTGSPPHIKLVNRSLILICVLLFLLCAGGNGRESGLQEELRSDAPDAAGFIDLVSNQYALYLRDWVALRLQEVSSCGRGWGICLAWKATYRCTARPFKSAHICFVKGVTAYQRLCRAQWQKGKLIKDRQGGGKVECTEFKCC